MTTVDTAQTASRTGALRRRAVLLAWFTVTWNAIEAVVALAAGAAADSSALVGFGLDSTIEVSSALVVLWHLGAHRPDDRERTALRLIAVSFFALAVWVATNATLDLARQHEPDTSAVGIALAVASLIVMPALAIAKQRTGRAMGTATVVADSAQTWLCTSLSAVLLVGLGANAWLDWWWADPVAGLAIAAVAAREGISVWRGDHCGNPAFPTAEEHGSAGCCAK
jgi:divalent metal cation (Fe/Co/Zn/Cd) transporter